MGLDDAEDAPLYGVGERAPDADQSGEVGVLPANIRPAGRPDSGGRIRKLLLFKGVRRVEQRNHNPRVGGSSPSSATTIGPLAIVNGVTLVRHRHPTAPDCVLRRPAGRPDTRVAFGVESGRSGGVQGLNVISTPFVRFWLVPQGLPFRSRYQLWK